MSRLYLQHLSTGERVTELTKVIDGQRSLFYAFLDGGFVIPTSVYADLLFTTEHEPIDWRQAGHIGPGGYREYSCNEPYDQYVLAKCGMAKMLTSEYWRGGGEYEVKNAEDVARGLIVSEASVPDVILKHPDIGGVFLVDFASDDSEEGPVIGYRFLKASFTHLVTTEPSPESLAASYPIPTKEYAAVRWLWDTHFKDRAKPEKKVVVIQELQERFGLSDKRASAVDAICRGEILSESKEEG